MTEQVMPSEDVTLRICSAWIDSYSDCIFSSNEEQVFKGFLANLFDLIRYVCLVWLFSALIGSGAFIGVYLINKLILR